MSDCSIINSSYMSSFYLCSNSLLWCVHFNFDVKTYIQNKSLRTKDNEMQNTMCLSLKLSSNNREPETEKAQRSLPSGFCCARKWCVTGVLHITQLQVPNLIFQELAVWKKKTLPPNSTVPSYLLQYLLDWCSFRVGGLSAISSYTLCVLYLCTCFYSMLCIFMSYILHLTRLLHPNKAELEPWAIVPQTNAIWPLMTPIRYVYYFSYFGGMLTMHISTLCACAKV